MKLLFKITWSPNEAPKSKEAQNGEVTAVFVCLAVLTVPMCLVF